MMNSMCLRSRRKNPLWIAAYCFKQLKKAQVFATDISSIVDKILQDEIDVVSYRVLSYLLLGVVRIYSKKVEYVLYDCDEVLIKINKFVINKKEIARVENLRMSVTIPDRFELDKFDLDVLEVTGEGHIASIEEITLGEVLCTSEGLGMFSIDKFEEFDFGENSRSVNHLMVEDVNQSHLMDIDFEVLRSNSPTNSLAYKNMDFDTVVVVQGVEEESSNFFSQDQQINNDERVQLTVPHEDQIHEKGRISQEGSVDISMIFGTQNRCVDHDEFSVSKENMEDITEGSVEKLEFQEKFPIQDDKLSAIPPQSKNLDATPQSMFQGGSVRRPKSGGTSPDLMLICTPALKERGLLSRKRKAVVDKSIVLTNEVLKKSLHDASDLISGRGRYRPTLLTMQRQSCISRIPDGLYESLLPCHSSELRILFTKKKFRIPDSVEIVETPGNSAVAESQTVGSPEHVAAGPQTPPQCPTIKARLIEHPERTEIENSDNLGPSTPHESIEIEQSLKRDKELNLTEECNVGSSKSCESLERGQSLTEYDDLNLMNEDINSCETENSDLMPSWSERTRNVARSLQKTFQDQRNKKEDEVVNFSQVVEGRVRKECARLFYEVLVLKSTSCVDVKQDNPYADIAIQKSTKLDETLATSPVILT